MKYIYLLSNNTLDIAFTLKTGIPEWFVRPGMSMQESYIRNTVESGKQDFETNSNLKVGEVFVIERINKKGLVSRINVHNEALSLEDVSPHLNPGLRRIGSYLDELKKYLVEKREENSIVIAYSEIAPQIEREMYRLVGELFLKSLIL